MMRAKHSPIFLMLVAIAVFAGAAEGQVASPAGPGRAASSIASAPPAAKPTQNSLNAVNPQAGPVDITMQPDQPTSLGELARLARAKKNSQAKAVKIFDDENMPRAPISAGEKAPEFSTVGQESSSGGKVTILDFWATWCGPCRHALPGLKQLQAIYGSDKVEVVSISEDEDEGAWSTFVAQNQMNWTQRLDSNHQIMRQYGASALPTYVLIGKDGTVIQQYVGDDPGEPIIERIGPDLNKSLQGRS
ncbi:MAG TPA: TlpA disulfide reductase family protein [Candidatus Acidoferrales bacterium]|nr:TlpA disulfide reductase family protein [Candidatus Acidoferrales bacterium]